jgi:HEAT repeat protein
MTKTTDATNAAELVDQLARLETRWAALRALEALGTAALPAVREGLRDGRSEVRRWCAIHLDHHGDLGSLEALVPLLREPKSKVRLWAVHSLSCDRCKTGENPIDVVPLLEERIRQTRASACAAWPRRCSTSSSPSTRARPRSFARSSTTRATASCASTPRSAGSAARRPGS